MAIPDYQTIMLPILHCISNGRDYNSKELMAVLGAKFNLTEEERKQRLPSGQDTVIGNRIGWAKTYLKNAGIIEQPKRGIVRISDEGKRVVEQEGLQGIDSKWLERYPSYMEFRNRGKKAQLGVEGSPTEETQTPEETLEEAYETMQDALASEILDQLKGGSPQFFEQWV